MIIAEKLVTKYWNMTHRSSLRHLLMLSGFLIMILLASCVPNKNLDDFEAQEKLDIQNFLSNNDTIDFEKKTSGLYYYDLTLGTGPQAETLDTAYVFYAMQYLSTLIFETNLGTTDTLKVAVNGGKFIPGFEEGISYMREGGTALFVVPSSLAFGAQGTYYVSPYTPFLFQVKLVKLKKH
jgi:FKBP-type peptidyl-prolyl cis-trans isomerase FkpA